MIASTAMNPRNVKVVFKKYMAFEQVHRTPPLSHLHSSFATPCLSLLPSYLLAYHC